MSVICTCADRTLTVSISGDIDHHSARGIMMEMERQIDALLPLRLIVNCAGITFMDSSGIAVLLRAWRRMNELGGSVRAIEIPNQAAKVLKAGGIEHLIPFH